MPSVKRKRSVLTEVGRAAMREHLRTVLAVVDWNLTRAARRLGMERHSQVWSAIRSLGLRAEYDAAIRSGVARRGRPPEARRAA